MKKTLCVSLAILTALLSGCGTVNQFQNTKKAASSAPRSGKSIEQMVSAKEFQTIEAKLKDGRPWDPLAVTNDGKIYGCVLSNDKATSQIILYDIGTGKIIPVCTTEKGFTQNSFSECEDYLFWSLLWNESNSEKQASRMKFVLYNMKSKTLKSLYSSRDELDTWMDHIALGKNTALWSEAVDGSPHCRVYQYDLSSGKTSVLQEDAYQPAVGDHFVAWLGRETSKNAAVYVKSLTTGKVEKITNGEHPTGLAACGDKLMYCGYPSQKDFEGKPPHKSELVLYQDGRKKILETSSKNSYEYPSMSASCVSWYENTATRIYSIRDDKIITLQNQYGKSLSCDSYLMWTTTDQAEIKQQAIKDGMYTVKINILKIPQ